MLCLVLLMMSRRQKKQQWSKGGVETLENLKFGTLSEFGKCEAVMSTCQKPVQDRPT